MARKTALKKPQQAIINVPVDAQPSAQALETVVATPIAVSWWDEDPRREQLLEMILDGMSKSSAAKQLTPKVHRNTVNNWCADARFVAEANARMNEHKAGKRIRRLRVTNLINDKIEKVTLALATQIEEGIIDKATGKAKKVMDDNVKPALSVFRQMAYEFRETRGQERIDYGDDIKKVAVSSQHTITGDLHVQHTGINDTPFVDYVRKSLNNRMIDVDAIEISEGESEGNLLLKAAEHLLVDTDLLDEINDEDKAHEEAAKQNS